MKRRIRLTESDLHRIIKESVNTILSEGKKKMHKKGTIEMNGEQNFNFKPNRIDESYDSRKKYYNHKFSGIVHETYDYLNNKFEGLLIQAIENDFKDDETVKYIFEKYVDFKI